MLPDAQMISAEEKLALYQLALQLFENGFSYPEVNEQIGRSVEQELASVVTEKAFRQEWDNLYQKVFDLRANNRIWKDTVDILSRSEPYRDVVELLANDIYNREFEVSDEITESEYKSRIWMYLFVFGLIQLAMYFINPNHLESQFRRVLFYTGTGLGAIGLIIILVNLFSTKKLKTAIYRQVQLNKYTEFMQEGRLKRLFQNKSGRILNIYCTAGFPQLNSTIRVMQALQKYGADIIELGIPYSDPLADGPVIQESGAIALHNGMSIKVLFEQLKVMRDLHGDYSAKVTVPVILMGYMNPVLQYGFEKFCADAAAVGIDGLILPDLPIREFETEYGQIVRKYNLDFIFLVTPETSEERIQKIDALTTGFIYAVSSSSTTGKDKNFSEVELYLQKLQQMKLKNPVLVGFGIKDKDTFHSACKYANGAIIGSAFIKTLKENPQEELTTKRFMEGILK